MQAINIYTRTEVKQLKDYLAKKDICIRSKTIVTGLTFENNGFAHEQQMYTIYQIISLPGQIFEVLYTPTPEDLINAGVITVKEYRENLI